jgi:peptide methionine sulfoxide reductase msrA/msrB
MKFNKLTKGQEVIILEKGTEAPFSGKYNNFFEKGLFVCARCNAPLYKSEYKFVSECGWPSFDDEIEGAVKRTDDPDGLRTEITCNNCEAHLGHVFIGEHLTDKNTRHCINSLSLKFIPKEKLKTAIFAAGCFWGVEYYFKKLKGVVNTQVGYTGGTKENPTYEEVCAHVTGHYEAIQVEYYDGFLTYEDLIKYFFEIHDFTQKDGQGPDIGQQYESVIFYNNEEEKKTAEKIIKILKGKAYTVATQQKKASKFWPAEEYHQEYYKKNGKMPYCHTYKKIF